MQFSSSACWLTIRLWPLPLCSRDLNALDIRQPCYTFQASEHATLHNTSGRGHLCLHNTLNRKAPCVKAWVCAFPPAPSLPLERWWLVQQLDMQLFKARAHLWAVWCLAATCRDILRGTVFVMHWYISNWYFKLRDRSVKRHGLLIGNLLVPVKHKEKAAMAHWLGILSVYACTGVCIQDCYVVSTLCNQLAGTWWLYRRGKHLIFWNYPFV